jgi:hypothetical protein
VTGCTVSVEDLFTGTDISGKGGGDGNTDGNCGTGNCSLNGLLMLIQSRIGGGKKLSATATYRT